MTSQTAAEEHREETHKDFIKDAARWQLEGNQSGEFLSYNLLTDIGVHMHQVSSVNGLHHSTFYSIAKDIMNWPFFLAFVAIDNDEDKNGDAKYN